jgi:hypothetical protein
MSSNHEVADFTTGNSNPVVCQRCLQSFKEGTELYYMRDSKAERAGKSICGGCRQYYIGKTQARETKLALSLSLSMNIVFSNNNSIIPGRAASASVQITPVAQPVVSQQEIRKAVNEAQRHGEEYIICRNTLDLLTTHLQVKITRVVLVNNSV